MQKRSVNKISNASPQCRSSRPEVFCEKGVLENPTKFTGKRLWHRCFPVNYVKFFRKPFFIERHWWLLLSMVYFGAEKKLKYEL